MHDEWTRYERRIWRKMEDSEALDRDQDNRIQQLEREFQQDMRELKEQIRILQQK
jgi:hypothetical protein